jgi:hypothetical protein
LENIPTAAASQVASCQSSGVNAAVAGVAALLLLHLQLGVLPLPSCCGVPCTVHAPDVQEEGSGAGGGAEGQLPEGCPAAGLTSAAHKPIAACFRPWHTSCAALLW